MEQEEKIVKLENWRNLFRFEGWKKEIVWIIIIGLLLYTYWGYKKDMEICLEIANDPCPYCFAQQELEKARQGGRGITFDLPEFKEVDNSSFNAT